MGAELGSDGAAVHAEADRVIRFWLEETPKEKRFARDAGLDAAIRERFAALREAVLKDPAPWRASARPALAAIILADQFSRNLHRSDARAFEGDALALAIANDAVAAGWDEEMTADERQFLYMPFMHSEDGGDQDRSVALFEALGNEEAADFARRHRDQIARFGRFPGRNAALGRVTTAAEEGAERF